MRRRRPETSARLYCPGQVHPLRPNCAQTVFARRVLSLRDRRECIRPDPPKDAREKPPKRQKVGDPKIEEKMRVVIQSYNDVAAVREIGAMVPSPWRSSSSSTAMHNTISPR